MADESKNKIEESKRMKRLPLYLFSIIDNLKKEAREQGIDLIDLGMGNPDKPAPDHVIAELCKRARDPKNHGYSRSIDKVEGELRSTIAKWYKKRFGIELDPSSEVLPLIGSKEGIAHLALAFFNNDDIALVPNPAYPVHFNGIFIAGGVVHNLPINEENNFLPDLNNIPKDILAKSKLLFLGYPHNPTTAVASIDFFKKAVAFGRKNGIMVVNDLAYSDIVYDGYKAPSILQVPGAKESCIEFHTLSKSYNMAGWRIGFAVGNSKILKTLAKLKSYVDFGLFKPIQYATIKALSGPQSCVTKQVALYKKRRDIMVDALNKAGWPIQKPKSTMYLWTKIPDKYSALTSMEFVSLLIKETGVVLSPGTGFGEYGEGYVRFALVQDEKKLIEAATRIRKLLEMEV
ncbi:class I/II aminotransferase [Candidatus Omnitrophus magneticus]|uniref:Class I/II aminotransferase n=1 Tax=Candidatus Omnitrophus magneticus TaxID=1609969 RepID=A0A0F0CW80_9BACT|nr:class I/II aminotransferase [Candidatus Omnitrophus magneticus]